MLGELCAVCLWKYVLWTFLRGGRWRAFISNICMEWRCCAHEHYFSVAFSSVVTHNYTDKNGDEFTPARAPSAGLERPGCHPPR